MGAAAAVVLEEIDPAEPGLRRVRRGRAFRYLDPAGDLVEDEAELARIAALAIPPAWRDVWISPLPEGHLQALGTDSAGRRQYLYHPEWRRRRDALKFQRMEEFAAELPRLRQEVAAALADEAAGLGRERVLACALRLLDRGFFRVGGDEYAAEHHTFGLATLERRHVRAGAGGELVFDYLAKGGKRRLLRIVDPEAAAVVAPLLRRRSGTRLLAYRAAGAGRAGAPASTWQELRAGDVNGWLKAHAGPDFSAKDFRTWHATVLGALSVAVLGGAQGPDAGAARRARTEVLACREVSRYLGNTPAVCRASYIDPRVFERWAEGRTVADAAARLHGFDVADPVALQGEVEAAVLELLRPARRARSRRAPVSGAATPGTRREPTAVEPGRSDVPPRGVKKGSKRARQYEHVKESEKERGVSEERAEEIAARTVNKARREHGETTAQKEKKGGRS